MFQKSDEDLLIELNSRIHAPCQGAQRIFRLTWDAVEIVHQESQGMEFLLEHDWVTPLEDYAAAFDEIGMPEVGSILRRVLRLIPTELRRHDNNEALRDVLLGRYDKLTELTVEFCKASATYTARAARYVRQHRNDFESGPKK